MKKAYVLIAIGLFLCSFAMAQSNGPELGPMFFQQLPAPGPGGAPPPLDVFFRTQELGNHQVSTAFVRIADAGKPVTGAPYSATAITESTQLLADGNKIVNKSTAALARDSQGRTRREETMDSIGPLAVHGPKMVFINDPVSKTNYIFDLNDQSAQVIKPGKVARGVAGGGKQITMPSGSVINIQKKVVLPDGPNGAVEQRILISNSANDASQVKTESLGTQIIEGVTAEGKRVTRTIPAGQIGNERPLEITSEVWTSPELEVTVLSKRNDPRFGETVYRLTDIKRAEPEHSLFEVPANFTIRDAPGVQ
jgi:hypothetical protein